MYKILFAGILLLLPGSRVFADDSAALQFTVAAPDPVMAGDEVKLQTLVVNTGPSAWVKGTYYWAGEIYTIEGENHKFLAQTETVSPQEDVAPGTAHGAQLSFTVPENTRGSLLYRVFLIKDGKRIVETDYKSFQVIEKEFHPPPPQDFKIGGDVTFSYKNSSADEWKKHQGITAANIVGKVKKSSFLFNTYIVHTYARPINPLIVLLNYYAPWGTLSVGDISPSLTPLSMDGQGMRGVSLDQTRNKLSWTALAGRIVAPDSPKAFNTGRFARYTGGLKASYQARPNLKISLNSVLSSDDQYSISIDTSASTLKPQQSVVYGTLVEWNLRKQLTFASEYQLSSHKPDLRSNLRAESGGAWKQELKYRGGVATARASLARVDPKFASFASPSVISDREVREIELGLYPADWTTFSMGFNNYADNLKNDPAKTTTNQTQTSFSNTLKVFGHTMINSSYLVNAAKGKPSTVQNNQTTTLNFSVLQPVNAHTLNLGLQTSGFKDKTHISHDLDTTLVSLSGAFKLSDRLSMSTGFVNSNTKDKLDFTTSKNNTITGNFTYTMPRRAMAVQLWTTISSNKNNSPALPGDSHSLSVNLETVWLKSRSSKFTFGVGGTSKKDKVNPANGSNAINILTRYNYSF
ncbi:MAG: hypothetical protein NTX59_11390 [Elusimicrobia bacterium]|nr:hypothetical protein [Elusimicrobiota bacterium]